jgi:LDH2 family malate/lactate/ureidoglycolate dehydrogenase
MVELPVKTVEEALTAIFDAVGCPPDEASLIAEELVLADQMGLGSHGAVRVGEYVEGARAGRVQPGGVCTVAHQTSATALVDGGMNYGQIVGRFALEVAAQKARETGVSCVVTRRSHHLGRVGSLMEHAAADDLIAIATVAVGLPGPVAPWGAAEGVLGTNPFAYGVPLEGRPAVTDFATSTSAEGAVRLKWQAGEQLADGTIIDRHGEPTNDPAELFTDPPGALLPFGALSGYKGYALNLLPELTAAALAGYGPDDPARPSNTLLLVVIDPEAFLPVEAFLALASASAARVKAARPRPGQTVLLPGEREFASVDRSAGVVRLPAETVEVIRAAAALAAVDVLGL